MTNGTMDTALELYYKLKTVNEFGMNIHGCQWLCIIWQLYEIVSVWQMVKICNEETHGMANEYNEIVWESIKIAFLRYVTMLYSITI